ncbi:hypothetical protein [Microvirga sp. 2TAF3]|uniref:hypothetical protein n=1 Tax=Microvirga sp. 2TAF3 TaxID=3233014 RepID=UPI003F964083
MSDYVTTSAAPNQPVLTANAVLETAANGTEIGRVIVSDPDGDALAVSLVDALGDTDLNSAFELIYDSVAKNYRLVVKDRTKIDFETTGGHLDIRVKVADATQSVFKAFTINIADVNEAPTNIAISHRSVKEHAAAGEWIADLSGTDPDSGDVLSYTIKNAASSPFEIVKNASGVYQLRVRDGSLIDYASDPDKKIDVTVIVTDKYGLTLEKTFMLDIERVNHAPTDILLENGTVLEHSAVDTAVGRLSTVDVDRGDTFTYRLLDDAGGRFKLDGNIVRVANEFKLDFEQQRTHQIKVLATDSAGATFEKTFTISVRDLNDEVVFGSAGDDLIMSGNGHDQLYGMAGNDTLVSGLGIDELTGGTGRDVFVFNLFSREGENFDIIKDFDVNEDKIHLVRDEFMALESLGVLDASAFHIGLRATTESHRIIYDNLSGDLYYDIDGAGGEAAVLIATFDSAIKPLLTREHFLVV